MQLRDYSLKLELQNVRFNTANKLIANRQIQLPYTEKHVICSYFNSYFKSSVLLSNFSRVSYVLTAIYSKYALRMYIIPVSLQCKSSFLLYNTDAYSLDRIVIPSGWDARPRHGTHSIVTSRMCAL